MKQLTIEDLFEGILDTFNEHQAELEAEDQTFTDAMEDDLQSLDDSCEDDCDNEMTPIEKLISLRISRHTADGTFPDLSEAQTIAILDQINRQYQD